MATSSKTALAYLGAFIAFWASSCSLGLNLGEKQCEKDADCKARGFADAVCSQNVCIASSMSSSSETSTGSGGTLPAGWECLGHFQYPDAMGQTVTQDFEFLDALSQAKVSSIKLKLCGPLDGPCNTPTMTGLKPDAMGKLSVDIPALQGVYLDIQDDSGGTGGAGGSGPLYRSSIAYLGTPIVIPPTLKTIRVITNQGLLTLAGILSATPPTITEDPTHGIALVLTPNCQDVRSAHVIVETDDTDSESKTFYFKGGVPSKTATETDDEGAVGLFNLPAGTAQAPRSSTFTTKLVTPECTDDHTKCPKIGSATVFIRPAQLTYVHIGPSP
jgi:hypothetical protein